MSLTLDQLNHSRRLRNLFSELAEQKYKQGAQEHGGNLWDKAPLELLLELREEVIDSFVYLQTAIDKLEKTDGK